MQNHQKQRKSAKARQARHVLSWNGTKAIDDEFHGLQGPDTPFRCALAKFEKAWKFSWRLVK
jgi:hypothetical protein